LRSAGQGIKRTQGEFKPNRTPINGLFARVCLDISGVFKPDRDTCEPSKLRAEGLVAQFGEGGSRKKNAQSCHRVPSIAADPWKGRIRVSQAAIVAGEQRQKNTIFEFRRQRVGNGPAKELNLYERILSSGDRGGGHQFT